VNSVRRLVRWNYLGPPIG